MSLYGNLLNNIILPLGDKIFKLNTLKHLEYFKKVQFFDKEKTLELQNKNLSKVLKFATEKVAFYKNLGIELTNDPKRDIKKFPILKKPVIKENLDDFLSQPKENLIRSASSGSSGIQGVTYLTKDEISISRSLQILWWSWAGYEFGNPLIQTGITPNRKLLKSLKDLFLKTTYVPAFGLNEQEKLKVLQKARGRNDYHLGGYASSLYIFSQVAKNNGIDDIKLKSAISWGDKMFAHYRTSIEETFHTKVFDTYGCGELIMTASQCSKGVYHITDPHVYVEIVDSEGNDVPDGEMGYVLLTKLDCFAMPLIRYYIGDLAVKSKDYETCKCGRSWSKLEKIIGRDTDLIKTPGGKYLVVHSFTGVFEHIPEIKQFMVVQRNLEGIEIQFIRDKGFNDNNTLNNVRNRIHKLVGEIFPIHFVEVDKIPPTASGKPQIIQNLIKTKL